MSDQAPEELTKIAQQIANERDTDTLVYIGGINIGSARTLVDLVGRRRKRKNLLFVLGTSGGDANAGYKISRCLQHAYEQGDFTVAVYGDCKSAGTLIALSAKKITMCQHGELGPLDVQLHKEDQLFAHSSGLTPKQALASLKEEGLSHFEHFLLAVHARSGYQISTRMAASIAIKMVVGLLGPVYSQVDPMRIGETQRAMGIARAYGERLNMHSNLKTGALDKLIEGYPSHDFAIDFDEAKRLFNRLVRTDDLERQLGEQLAHLLLSYKFVAQDEAIVVFVNPEPPLPEVKETDKNVHNQKNDHAKKDTPARTRARKGESSAAGSGSRSSTQTANGRPSGETTAVKAERNGKKAVVPTAKPSLRRLI